jgi:hypothetical protein
MKYAMFIALQNPHLWETKFVVCPLRRQSIIYVSIYKKKLRILMQRKNALHSSFFIIENDSLLGYILLTSYKLYFT